MTNSTLGPDGYFGFKPNKGAEYFVVVVYFVLTVFIFIRNCKHRTWFMMPIALGGAFETFAFAWRIYETYHNDSEMGYILYLVPVLVAPTILAAADYNLASVVMYRANVRIPFFTPKVTKVIFLVCDIAAFFIQGIGGSIAGTSKSESQAKFGSNVVLVGLGISLAVFLIFLLLSFALQIKIRAQPGFHDTDTSWMRIFYVVYVNMLCLSIRAFYRVAEFHGGNTRSKLSIDEVYFYTLDAMLMIILMASWCIFHPYYFGLAKSEDFMPQQPVPATRGEEVGMEKDTKGQP